jgi:hypothetical protein
MILSMFLLAAAAGVGWGADPSSDGPGGAPTTQPLSRAASELRDAAEQLWEVAERTGMRAAELRRWWNENAGQPWEAEVPYHMLIAEDRDGGIRAVLLTYRNPDLWSSGVAVAREGKITLVPREQLPKLLESLEAFPGAPPSTAPAGGAPPSTQPARPIR